MKRWDQCVNVYVAYALISVLFVMGCVCGFVCGFFYR